MSSNERHRQGDNSEHLEIENGKSETELVGIYREMYRESLTGPQNRVLLVRTSKELTPEELTALENNGYRVHQVHSLKELQRGDVESAAHRLLYGAQCVTEVPDKWEPELYYKAAIVIDEDVFEEGKQDSYVRDLFSKATIYGKIIDLTSDL